MSSKIKVLCNVYASEASILKEWKSGLDEDALAIVSKETFQAVQIENSLRTNVIKGDGGNKRKSTKYSSKK